MSVLHKHNPVLQNKLQSYITAQDVNGLVTCLQSLSVGEFRTAGYMLGEKVLVTATKDYFWKVFIQFTRQNAKAFLGTCLKAFVRGYKGSQLIARRLIAKKRLKPYYPFFARVMKSNSLRVCSYSMREKAFSLT